MVRPTVLAILFVLLQIGSGARSSDLSVGAEFPPQETALVEGEVAFRQHAGGHTTGPNWPTFLKFADRYLKGPPPAAPKPAAPDRPLGRARRGSPRRGDCRPARSRPSRVGEVDVR